MNKKEIPQYKSHKVVRAAKIERVNIFNDDGDAEIFMEGGIETSVCGDWMRRVVADADKANGNNPDSLIGGYFVQYDDGYASWSPAKAFEEGYTPVAQAKEPDPIEHEIQAKGLTAPRITPADIEANLVSEHYFTAAQGNFRAIEEPLFEVAEAADDLDGLRDVARNHTPAALNLLTFCVLVLRNGFTVTGESACASPENFDAEVGKKIARQNAVSKVWPLMGYELRSKLWPH